MIGSQLVKEKVKKPRSHGGGKDAYIRITKHDRKPISHGRRLRSLEVMEVVKMQRSREIR